ncbi:MAG: cytochrome P450 [Candidatus Baltobacteraceae bacterium]
MDARIPGPSRGETFAKLGMQPFLRLPTFLAEVSERYGAVAAFQLPFRRFLFLNDPSQIKDVLVTQQHAFVKSEGGRALRRLLGNGLLTSEEPEHRQMRRIVQPAFHRERIAAYARAMLEHARRWCEEHADTTTIEMHSSMSELTLRIASETLFGVDAGERASEVRAALRATMESYPSGIGPLGQIRSRLGFLPVTRRFNEARARLDEIVYGLIAQRRASAETGGDALSLLIAAEDAEDGYRPSDRQVRDEALTLFLAGHETTANALLWTWYLLAHHPEVERRLHDEVDGADFSRDPMELWASLEYTRRVFRESMRLYPPAWIFGREAREPVKLVGGYDVDAGTTVLIAPLVLHRRPDLFPDPERFDPERWLRGDTPQFAYVPFGGGARRCIGEEFAWTEGVLVLATLARAFRFTLCDERELETVALVTLRPKGPVAMRATRR